MALSDILHTITAETDNRLQQLRKVHTTRMDDMRSAHERSLASMRKRILLQQERELRQKTLQAQGHADMQVRHAVLRRKREHLDAVYQSVVDRLCALPDKVMEPLLRRLLSLLPEGGTVTPSARHATLLAALCSGTRTIGAPSKARGGFSFESPILRADCTMEHLVEELLKPSTEIATAHSLFPTL